MSVITLEDLKKRDPLCRVQQNLASVYNSVIDLKATNSFALPLVLSLTNNTVALTDQMYLIFNYEVVVGTATQTFQPGGLTHGLFTSYGMQQSSYPLIQINTVAPQIIGQLYNCTKLCNSNLNNIQRTSAFDDDIFIACTNPYNQGQSLINDDGTLANGIVPTTLQINTGRTLPVSTTSQYLQYGLQQKFIVPGISPTLNFATGLLQWNISCSVDPSKILVSGGTWTNVTTLKLIRVDCIYTSVIMSSPMPENFQMSPVKQSINVVLGQLPSPQPLVLATANKSYAQITSNNLQLTSQRLRMIYLFPFISTVSADNITMTAPRPYNSDGKVNTITLIPSNQEYSNYLCLPQCLNITQAGAIIGGSLVYPTNNLIDFESPNYFCDWVNYYFTVVAHDNRTSDGGSDSKCPLDYSSWLYFKFLAFNVGAATGNFANQAQIKYTVKSSSPASTDGTLQINTNYILVSIVEITNTL